MSNFSKKAFCVFTSLFILFNFIWAQESETSPELEMDAIEQKELEEKLSQPDELQKNFIILEGLKIHELNPQVTSYSSDSQILSGLYEGLFSYHPVTLEPEYAIAKSYKISRDKKRWTITLREDAYFSNGENITADSVRDSWLRLLSTPNAPYASLLDIIRGASEYRTGKTSAENVGIYAVDEHTLSIYLLKPANYLPRVLCHSAFSITHRLPTVYSGPYELYDTNGYTYILRKNPYYWDFNNVRLEQISFYQSDDMEYNTYLYNVGQVDWVTTNIDTNKVLDKKAVQVNAEFGTSYYFFKLSNKKPSKKASVWDYPEFRNAILEAFPWEDVRGAAMVPASTFVFPLSAYPQIEGFSYTDQREALLKMQDARKKYGIPEDEILPLNFAITSFTLSQEKQDIIADALKKLGVQITFTEVPANDYISTMPMSEADLFAYTWIGDFADPLAFLELFRADSTLNDSGWSNKEYDDLLDQAAVVSDTERLKLLGQAEVLLLDSGMVLPIYHPVTVNVIDSSEVGGWSTNAFDVHPLKYLYKKLEEKKHQYENLIRFER